MVAWLKSKYFPAKRYGLANQFDGGCEVVRLDEGNVEDVEARLQSAILAAWNSAEQVCPRLSVGRTVRSQQAVCGKLRQIISGGAASATEDSPLQTRPLRPEVPSCC